MRASSPLEKYVLKALYSKQSKRSLHMSSIAMAHSNVDLVDSIDVISDAEVSWLILFDLLIACYSKPSLVTSDLLLIALFCVLILVYGVLLDSFPG